MFKRIAKYLDIGELLNIAKVKGLERYKKLIKFCLKSILYAGISTKDRIEYWFTIGKIIKKEEEHLDLYEGLQMRRSESETAIAVDISRTYPSLYFFKTGALGYVQLSRILKAISLVFPDIGYCQGMNFFSALILIILGNEEVKTAKP
eukprot:TRINITY_DN2413_c0_g1_i23.p2 TRINITY_DN2413_c0_g1~~TRINITY_DN2413_c0_g1_i23.p2  ORF type:complete len:148 (-),score=27.35 TRINITY_DN2413_c0_g1_i23:802-1245(-)